jgi:diguanylate cyclase (GGDEF)-like protein
MSGDPIRSSGNPRDVAVHHLLVRYVPIGCLVTTGRGGHLIRHANDDAAEVLGTSRDQLLGTSLASLVMPEFEAQVNKALTEAGAATTHTRVRLIQALAPVELAVRSLDDGARIVTVRSLEQEHRYSAQAGGDLTHDQVTGFPNRYHLLSLLDQKIRATPRHPLALIGLWIDELPQLVTSRGEATVERVVREVAQRVHARLRSPDLLGRFDDAGFLGLLASEAPIHQLTEIAERLRAEVAFPVEFDGTLVSFTASVAVASIRERRPTIDKTMTQLGAAAHRAATGGGNRTEILEL